MGQYWLPVNLTKKEWIDPHKLGSGLKLWEQMANDHVGTALVLLTAAFTKRRGSGDPDPGDPIGRWAGDRIALVGDYAEREDLPQRLRADTLYRRCRDGVFTDITDSVCAAIERELGGKFSDTSGWRDFIREGE